MLGRIPSNMRARHAVVFLLPWMVAACGSKINPVVGDDAAVDATVDATVDSSFTDGTMEVGEDGATEVDVGLDGAVSDGVADGTDIDAAPDATVVDTGTVDDTGADDAYDATDTRDTAPPDTAWTATLCALPATDAATDTEVVPDAADGSASCSATRVRIMAANTTSGSSPTYQDPGIRIFQAMKPDIALVQELKYAGGVRALVDVAFGTEFQTALEISPGSIPNGIVSRYPILEQGEWDDPDATDRDFVWARIDVPGPIDLWAVSVHFRTAGSLERDTEARNLIAYIAAKVPATDYLVIGGDLNTAVETELALFTLSSRVSIAPPYAVDQAWNNKTSSPRSKPYDWVLPSPNLLGHMMPVRIGSSWFEHGFVFDTRVFTPIEQVAPALALDSAAVNMQHMAVVRDFALGD